VDEERQKTKDKMLMTKVEKVKEVKWIEIMNSLPWRG
jgi:hypothetical protein